MSKDFNFLQFIKERRSIRKFKSDPVPEKILEEILESGNWAPSVHNSQPWKFIVLKDKSKERFISLLETKKKKLLTGFNVVLSDAITAIKQVPLIILIYNTKILSRKFSRFGKIYENHLALYEIESVSAAVENILISAHFNKLGIRWLGITTFCENEINKYIGTNDKLMALLAVGYPKEIPQAPKRKSLREVMEVRG